MTAPRSDRSDEFRFVEVGERTYMVRCRQEVPFGLLVHGGFAHWRRTVRDEPRWLVSIESDRAPLPILREAFDDEADARARVDELVVGLADGSIRVSSWPALIRSTHRRRATR